jgi:hypothetical protein
VLSLTCTVVSFSVAVVSTSTNMVKILLQI